MIELEHDIARDMRTATAREWLVTNGIGGFASGTISGVLRSALAYFWAQKKA